MNVMSSLYRRKVLDFGIEMLLINVSFRMISFMLILPVVAGSGQKAVVYCINVLTVTVKLPGGGGGGGDLGI